MKQYRMIKGVSVTVILVLSLLAVAIPVNAGTLQLVKGSWDVLGLDHNKVADGPNCYLIQIHVTNTAGTAALGVTATLTWDTANVYINLATNEVAVKNLGDIAAGATVDVFYLVEVTRDSNAYNTTRDYTITVQGTNTGTADTITGQLLVERLRSQARNEVISTVASTTTPTKGDTFTITVVSQTGAKNYAVVNLPISEFDPTIIELVSVSVTWVEPPAPPVTSDNVRLDTPGDDEFTSVWTFRAVEVGTTTATSFITDQSGGSFHYNADYPDSVTITVLGSADIRMEKTVSNPTPNVGDTVTFTITVYNDGPDTATNVGVEDVIPNGYTYVAASIAGGDSRDDTGAPTLTWTINSLANGANTALTFQAVVQAAGDYKNVAQVTASDQNDPDSTPNNDDGDQSEDDEDFATTTPLRADLRMEKTVSNPTPNVGDTVTFTITVYNDGPDTATNVGVEDVIPNGYTYVAASIAGGDSRDDTGVPTLTWTINSLANGANTALTFQAVVQASGNYKNVAQVTASDQNDPDSTPNNDDGDQSEDDEDFATTTPLQADLRMEKTVNNPTPNVGDTVTFTITVYNDGPDTATTITVEDVIPTGYTYVAASIAGGDSRDDTGAPTLTWTINSLANGANTALTFQAVVQASGNYKNVSQVTASDQNDPDSTPNNDDGDQSEDDEDFATTTPLQADIRIEKTVNNPTPTAGDTVTFTITVYNDGPDTATNITVEDVIPNGYTYVAASIAGGDSRDDTGVPTLTWTINSLANGANTALTFQAVVQAAGDYKNVAQVTASDQYDPDSTPNNDDGDQSEDDEDFETAAPSEADIRIEKTVNDPTPTAGDTVTFTITVYNDGPDTATNITVEDVIPNGYSYVAASIAGGDSRDDTGAPTLTWTINSLASGNNTALTFQAVVQAAGNYRNVAQVTASDQYDPDSTPNNDDGDQSEDDEDFAIASPQEADLRMEKTVSDPTPNVGDTITFTITVYNDGPDTATNITVEDVIPNGYTYVAASIAGGDSRDDTGAPTLTWTINSLASGNNTALTFQAVVQAAGNYRNVAQVTASDQNDPDSTPNNDDGDQSEDDEDFATTTPLQADIRMEKTVSDPTPNVGDTITFTITVYNDGPDTATNITVEDVIPTGYSYVAASIAGGDSRDDTGAPTLTWTINSLANGTNTALTFQAVVQAAGNYKNVAQVTASDQNDPDSTPNNDDGDQSEDDEDFATTTPQQADIRMEKTVNDPTPTAGDTVTFTITVYNDGPDTATNITVEDVIPTGYSYVAASIAGGDSRDDTGAPTLTWTINSLANGANTALTFQAVVQAAGNYRNVAQVTASDQNDPDSTPNNDDGDQSEDDEDFATTTPLQADIRMEKTVSNPTPNVGDTVTFTITVYNDGPDTATNITVEDVIPTGYTYVAASIAGGDSRDDTGAPTLTWTINSLANGANTALTFQAVVQAAGNYRNVAQVTASDLYDPDSTPNNDDGDQSEDDEDFAIASPQEADLRMQKTVNNPTPNVGDTVTFTITVYNDGPDTATNITVEDVIPTGYTYVAASIAGGDSRDDTGVPTLTWTINSLANGANTALTFQAVVQAAGNFRNVTQVTASDQYDPDSTPNNDDGDQSEDDEDFTAAPPSEADLWIVKNVDNPTPNIGDTVTFTITVYNAGPDTATNVSVEDVIPTGYTYVAASIAGGDARDDTGAPTLTWTINSLANGANTALTFQAVVLAAGNYINVTQVTASDQYDPNSTPNNDDGDQSEDDEDSEATTPVGGVPAPGITVEKTVSSSVATAGSTVTFTLTITNTGSVLLNPVTIVDILSPGFTYANAASLPPDTVIFNLDNTTTITWLNVGPLNPSDTITITFNAVFNGIEPIARNVATATGTPPTGPPVTDEGFAIVVLPSGTPNQPPEYLQPLANNLLQINCYEEFRDLIEQIREADPDITWVRKVPCCEALEDLVQQLIDLVLKRGLDKQYPEEWERIQELLIYVAECCGNAEGFYEEENYTASIHWSHQRDKAYRELIEILLEILGY